MKVLQEPKRHVASRRARPSPPPFHGASIFVKFTYRKVNKNEAPPPFWKHVKKLKWKEGNQQWIILLVKIVWITLTPLPHFQKGCYVPASTVKLRECWQTLSAVFMVLAWCEMFCSWNVAKSNCMHAFRIVEFKKLFGFSNNIFLKKKCCKIYTEWRR